MLRGHRDRVNCLDTVRDTNLLYSGSGDKSVIVWNWRTGEMIRSIFAKSRVFNLIVIHRGEYLLTGMYICCFFFFVKFIIFNLIFRQVTSIPVELITTCGTPKVAS